MLNRWKMRVIGSNMKPFVKKLLTFISLALAKNVTGRNSTFVLNKVKIDKGNNVSLFNAYISRLCINLIGAANKVIVEEGRYVRGEILISGHRNKIVVKEGACLANTRLILRGNDCSIYIGKDVTAGSLFMTCMGKDNYIHIGNDCMLSEGVDIWATDSHVIIDEISNDVVNHSKPVTIGNHVWLGKDCAILKGVTIGDGAIVGMRSLVTKDIARHTLNVGMPAKQIKENVTWKRGFIKE